MRFSKYLVAIVIFASIHMTHASSSDTLDLVGGSTNKFNVGWYGESWVDSAQHWCGDTTYKDLTIDTTIKRDTSRFTDLKRVTDTIKVDTGKVLVVRDTLLPDSLITIDTTIKDSSVIFTCDKSSQFVADSGSFTAGIPYMNYFYKFRNWYAQLPFVWSNWQGLDGTGYKYLMITYKGLLPTHQMSLNFFYAAWGPFADTSKDKNRGDGIATLLPTTEWKTEIIKIPDSVDMVGITGMNIGIGNAPVLGGGQTSDVGNLKVERISLLVSGTPVKYRALSHKMTTDRFQFIPKVSGKVSIAVYSLKGEILYDKSITVDANKMYSIKQFAKQFGATTSPQVRLLKVKGAGIEMNMQIR